MRPNVTRQMRALGEALVAVGAHVRLLSRVRPQVCAEVGLDRRFVVAQLTRVQNHRDAVLQETLGRAPPEAVTEFPTFPQSSSAEDRRVRSHTAQEDGARPG